MAVLALLTVVASVLAEVHIPKLRESSGVAASRTWPGILWTHNDSGNAPNIYAIDRAGKLVSTWRVNGAREYDWEDIALGPGGLYIADIGDNNRKRDRVTIYRIPEPDPRAPTTPGTNVTKRAEIFRFTYPDGPHDAEALLVHPKTGDLYIVTKAQLSDRHTSVFRARAPLRLNQRPQKMEKVADLDLPRNLIGHFVGISGGSISPDGRYVILCDYTAAYEAALTSDWNTLKWKRIDLDTRQREGITYSPDGKSALITSEGETFPLVELSLH